MPSARKIWSDAKAKVKTKNWEANTKLGRDDFGPDIEGYEKNMTSMQTKLKSAFEDLKKAAGFSAKVQATYASYKSKIETGAKANYISTAEQKILQDALKEVKKQLESFSWQLGEPKNEISRVIGECIKRMEDL